MSKAIAALILSFLISLIFFNRILFGEIPFPGDLLVGNYEPYKSVSFDNFLPGSVPHKAQGPDVIKELLPWKKFVTESLARFEIPLWNPYNFSGNPMLANFQSGVFYPGNLIFLVTDFSLAWTLYIYLTPVFSIFFMYLFLRRLDLGFWPCLFGGLSFAFSLYMTVWMEYGNIGHTFLWLPLALFFTDKLIKKVSARDVAGLVLTLFISSVGGYIQGLFYIYGIVIAYFFIKAYSTKKLQISRVSIFLVAAVIPVMLSAFQLLPTFELFSNSSRGNYSLEQITKLLNPVWYLITAAVPDFFGNPASRNYWFNGTYIEKVSYFGLVPLIFALFALVTKLGRIEVKIFSIIFVVVLILTSDLIFNRLFYLIPIPVISTTVPTRMLSIFTFAGAVLAAIGFNEILLKKNKKSIFLIIGTMIVLLVSLSSYLKISVLLSTDPAFISNFSVSFRNVILPFAVVIAFAFSTAAFLLIGKKIKKNPAGLYILIIFLLTIFELYYYFQKITPFAPKGFMYPETPVTSFIKEKGGIDRFWGYGSGYIESNFQTYDKTFSTEGNDPLHIKGYTELLAASKNGRIPEILPRPDANIAGGFGKEDLANNPFRQKVLNITGVRYVLHRDEGIRGEFSPDTITFPQERYKLIWQDGYWQVYENLEVVPRFLVTNNYVVSENSAKALRTLFDADFDERTSLILSEDPKVKGGDISSSAVLKSYTSNKVEIETEASAPALLFLSDNYYPGWEAYIDGIKSKIFLADYSFRAVKIPEGKHLVTFEFRPKSFYNGIYISLVSSAIFLLAIYVIKRRYEE